MTKNHFTATGIVFNGNMEMLMIHHKKLHVWLPPGGHVDENELPEDAALREIFEETGVRVGIISTKRMPELEADCCRELEPPFLMLLEDIDGDGTHNHIDMIYLCEAQSDELSPQQSEVSGIGWFSIDEIKKLNTYENVVKTACLALSFLNDRKTRLCQITGRP